MPIVERYKQDPESVYNTRFIGSEDRAQGVSQQVMIDAYKEVGPALFFLFSLIPPLYALVKERSLFARGAA